MTACDLGQRRTRPRTKPAAAGFQSSRIDLAVCANPREALRIVCYETQVFRARLPEVTAPVSIQSLCDAQIFSRRWVIRDKDPALKKLVRLLDRARGGAETTSALRALQDALASRNLLS